MREGTVLKWLKQEGDEVCAGEPVVEVETDKVVVEIPAEGPGFLRKILVHHGETVPVLTPLAYVGDLSEALPVQSAHQHESVVSRANSAGLDVPKFEASSEVKRPISPRARKLAEQHRVDLSLLPGTGPSGRITEKDVKDFLHRTRLS
jgi:pyruvate dehydrogenase E2 component (dihydrolipoamide acetyltransferase)